MDNFKTGTRGGWVKHEANPVLGGELGVCFDIAVVKKEKGYKMFFSWRTHHSVAVTDSEDGIHWTEPQICIAPREREDEWETLINRPGVVYKDGIYHLWYTGQCHIGTPEAASRIFYATSTDGLHFERREEPVLVPELPWEKLSVMIPDVMWDEEEQIFKMWYSAGETFEPDAIGYAVSHDGIHWEKKETPVFRADPANEWEQAKVGGCHVMKVKDGYLMFYIGYHNVHYAQIGIAKSPDGLSNWYRLPENPIIAPDPDSWDAEACYKPFALYDGEKWVLWYNGRKGEVEQIGVAVHTGYELF